MFIRGEKELLVEDGALGGPSLGGFEEEDAEATEIITLAPGESPPQEEDEGADEGKITLTKEEYEQLRSGKDSAGVLAEGLKELRDVIGGQSQPANAVQQPGESDEDFEKRLEQDMFAEGKGAKAIKEAIERYGGGQVAQLMSMLSAQNKKLLQMDEENGPVFKRYKDEIEKVVRELPENQQNHPQVWEYALGQVKSRHKDELDRETIDEQVERRVAEKLKELGLDKEGEGERAKGGEQGYVESGRGRGSANGGSGVRKKRIYITEQDRRIARDKGMPVEEYIKRKGAVV